MLQNVNFSDFDVFQFSPRAVIQGSCVITCASIRVHALIFESQKNLVKIVLVLFWIVDHESQLE